MVSNFPGSINENTFENGPISSFSNQNSVKEFILDEKSVDSSSLPSPTNLESLSNSGMSPNGDSTEPNKYSNPILRYISDILMDEEDDLKHKPCMLQDCLALQAAEKSFYNIIGGSYSASPHQIPGCFHDENIDSPDDNFKSNSGYTSDNSYESSPHKIPDAAPDPFRATQADIIHSLTNSLVREGGAREKRSHQLDDTRNEDDRRLRDSKLSAVYSDDSEVSEMFDEVLLYLGGPSQSIGCGAHEPSKRSPGKASRSKKGANEGTTVDLWTLLTQCAQAVASYDQRSANDLLKQIRQHSSRFGNGIQRLAHYFAKGLETRLAAGTPSYMPLRCNGATTADMLKAYKLYITVSPFQRISNILANRMIMKQVKYETSLHIIDFGISYGFQWPCLIQLLSERPGAPIKLRMTGIEFPQPGFRPAERVEETGRRLANYCRRFNVPFEYNAIAQKWETIQFEDLKIDRTEITVVNCLYQLKNLPDETLVVDCPRDAVLKLIRKINPNIFIHGIVNGTHNAPFFLNRFREALFYFSALFDMFEANVLREDTDRLMFEEGILGRDALNVIASEGSERVERPETYKQWQRRNRRAGFKQIRVEPERLNRAKEIVKIEYHKDFVVDEDGKWVLLGWKGRTIQALSCWKPA